MSNDNTNDNTNENPPVIKTAEQFTKHVGAASFSEAVAVTLRTKQQDEDKIAEMFDIIKKQRKVNEWQPIETAPDCGGVLVTDGGQVSCAFCLAGEWIEASLETRLEFEPTHWMPLPKPPKEAA